jgi:MFS family permease
MTATVLRITSTSTGVHLENGILGYLSDYIGRRIVWIISVSGTLIKELILLLTILLHLPIWVLYIAQIIFALTGTYNGAMVSIFATIADVTPPGKSRSFRITVS